LSVQFSKTWRGGVVTEQQRHQLNSNPDRPRVRGPWEAGPLKCFVVARYQPNHDVVT
jgi:hypothetical protein